MARLKKIEDVKKKVDLLSVIPKARLKGLTKTIKQMVAAQRVCREQGFNGAADAMALAFQLLEHDLVMEFLAGKPAQATEELWKDNVKVVWKPVKVKK